MKLKFLQLPPEERGLYFTQAAGKRGLSPIILEKDFWVCWMLAVLFNSEFSNSLVFKGGTSLSKVFKAIQRFSEDIDLGLTPEFLGLSEPETGAISKSQAGKWMAKAEIACTTAIKERVQPEIERMIVETLGQGKNPWLEAEIDPRTKAPILWFHYPTTQAEGFDYLKRSVKLEFGSLTDQQPVGRHIIRPWIADEIPQAFEDWHCEVVVLELERTFWEKATILHTEHHRPSEMPLPDRYSRHYADVAALAEHSEASRAAQRHDLRERVVAWKSQFFGSKWSRYDLAEPGTFKLIPQAERLPALRSDYQEMSSMYLAQPLEFDQILAILAKLEEQINKLVNTQS